MAIYLRRANQDDLQRVMEIIEQARAQLKEKGNPQWQDGHPFPKTMKSDIKAGYNWVLIDNQKIVGTATLQLTPEQTYEEIKDGSWLKPNEPYAIIHRLAVLPSKNGQVKIRLGRLKLVGNLNSLACTVESCFDSDITAS